MRVLTVFAALAICCHADTVKYTYDDAGRLATVTYGSGKTIAYSYDKAGNLVQRTVTAPASAAAAKKADSRGKR